ncbi:HAD hydrolase subfamily IA protein [Dioscorea alata]|uniref:HAD hydrolase subfamily IA protein n=1 Tax=Dioscorea alata TaxID=55571 RepID=A0ACB7WD24_DIOAL|nr:HAD hydrolase subfamily IA protein [Dioscorea alata]
MPGALELCGFLDSKKIRRGLITRNVDAAVDLFHQRFGIMFAPALSREFRPYKPDPAPLLHICSTWDVSPNEVMMIGDSLRDDVVCGRRAGATCWMKQGGMSPRAVTPMNKNPILRYPRLRKFFLSWKTISIWSRLRKLLNKEINVDIDMHHQLIEDPTGCTTRNIDISNERERKQGQVCWPI